MARKLAALDLAVDIEDSISERDVVGASRPIAEPQAFAAAPTIVQQLRAALAAVPARIR